MPVQAPTITTSPPVTPMKALSAWRPPQGVGGHGTYGGEQRPADDADDLDDLDALAVSQLLGDLRNGCPVGGPWHRKDHHGLYAGPVLSGLWTSGGLGVGPVHRGHLRPAPPQAVPGLPAGRLLGELHDSRAVKSYPECRVVLCALASTRRMEGTPASNRPEPWDCAGRDPSCRTRCPGRRRSSGGGTTAPCGPGPQRWTAAGIEEDQDKKERRKAKLFVSLLEHRNTIDATAFARSQASSILFYSLGDSSPL